VQLIWAREEDLRHDMYRPAAMSKARASLNSAGLPEAWHQRLASASVSSDFVGRVLNAEMLETPDKTNVEGAAWRPYAIENIRIEHVPVHLDLSVGFWRSVGFSQNAFFFESFLDELAHKAGIDPLSYRLQLLAAHPRYQKVLTTAAAMLDWQPGQTHAGTDRGRGIALVESFGAIVAQAMEVRMLGPKRMRLERVACAVDAGFAVHPDQLAAQMEGGIVYGLSAAMYGRIDLADSAVVQSNFHDYPVLRMNELRDVQVEVLNGSTDPDSTPGGGGESGTPPAAPALCNALFAATGERVRSLPLASAGYALA
jgi:isoquinoline 1-oxidoreductase beta subunit